MWHTHTRSFGVAKVYTTTHTIGSVMFVHSLSEWKHHFLSYVFGCRLVYFRQAHGIHRKWHTRTQRREQQLYRRNEMTKKQNKISSSSTRHATAWNKSEEICKWIQFIAIRWENFCRFFLSLPTNRETIARHLISLMMMTRIQIRRSLKSGNWHRNLFQFMMTFSRSKFLME